MAVPSFQSYFLPILKFLSDGKEHTLREAYIVIAEIMKLNDEDLNEMVPSGTQRKHNNRVSWAGTYLKKAGLLESTGRGKYRITSEGKKVLELKLDNIDNRFLKSRYPRFKDFHEVKPKLETDKSEEIITEELNPDELIEITYQKMHNDLAIELLEAVKKYHPSLFEQLVVDLIVAMGYGGSRKDAGEATQRTSDEGIDGLIKEDKLGLDVVYIQAKRWENSVGRPELQKFAGSLEGKRAKKGIFITTSSFSKGAVDYVSRIEKKIVLIDGEKLTDLMIDHNIGVSEYKRFELKKIDWEYFNEG